jgi:CheY-like chemotaxis protein
VRTLLRFVSPEDLDAPQEDRADGQRRRSVGLELRGAFPALARLLVVDDEEADRIVLQTILERADHVVFTAQDGREALEVFQGRDIQVVITDLQMDDVHGLELITIVRDFDPRPPIIAISGTGEVQLEMAQALGAQRTLTKPVDPQALLSAVREVLAGVA